MKMEDEKRASVRDKSRGERGLRKSRLEEG